MHQQPEVLDEDGWEYAWSFLHYRMGSMQVAKRLVNRLGLEVPKEHQWDKDDWLIRDNGTKLNSKAEEYLRLVVDRKLIPTFPGTRKFYDKPLWYLPLPLPKAVSPTRMFNHARLGIAQKIVQIGGNIQCARGQIQGHFVEKSRGLVHVFGKARQVPFPFKAP